MLLNVPEYSISRTPSPYICYCANGKMPVGAFKTSVAQGMCAYAANSKYATGYPHSQDHWGAVYGFVGFLIALFGTWPAANNAAIFAEVCSPPPVQAIATPSMRQAHHQQLSTCSLAVCPRP